MGLFGKKKDKEKEKKGFFGWKKRKQEAEIPERDAEIVPPEPEKETDDIAKQILAEREAARQEEAETWRAQAEETIAEEQAEAAALAAKAAQEELLPEDNETEDEDEDEEENETEDVEEEDDEDEKDETEDAEDETEDKEAEIAEDEETEKEETAEKPEEKEPEEKEDKPEEAVEQETEIEETIEASEPEEVVEQETETEETTETSESPEAESQEPEASEPEEPETEEPELEEKKKGILQKIREGLRKTKNSVIAKMQLVLNAFTKIDEDLFEQLEETMIMGDMGAETSIAICDQLRKRVKERGITDPKQIMGLIQEIIGEMLGEDQTLQLNTKPSVIMVIGVNGAGKTTTIGKMCHQFKEEGKKVIVAAADTFRAAAIDQLQVWTDRAGVDLVKHTEGSDPGAVVYDAIEAAKARDCDVLICDTAGRLHNKKNLMNELAKINRILETKAAGCDKEILLVLDATTGQNAVNQARLFKEVADITGIVLTKLDGTAKGGIVVSIKNELQIPVKLIGVGEKIDDLQPFHAEDFVNALFEKEERL